MTISQPQSWARTKLINQKELNAEGSLDDVSENHPTAGDRRGIFSLHFFTSFVRRDAAGLSRWHCVRTLIYLRGIIFQRDLSLSHSPSGCSEFDLMWHRAVKELKWMALSRLHSWAPGHTSVCKHGGIPNTPGPSGGGIIWHFRRATSSMQSGEKGCFIFRSRRACHCVTILRFVWKWIWQGLKGLLSCIVAIVRWWMWWRKSRPRACCYSNKQLSLHVSWIDVRRAGFGQDVQR
jgi:hypothetical protein